MNTYFNAYYYKLLYYYLLFNICLFCYKLINRISIEHKYFYISIARVYLFFSNITKYKFILWIYLK